MSKIDMASVQGDRQRGVVDNTLTLPARSQESKKNHVPQNSEGENAISRLHIPLEILRLYQQVRSPKLLVGHQCIMKECS